MPNKEGHKRRYRSRHDCFGNPTYLPGGQGGLIEDKQPELLILRELAEAALKRRGYAGPGDPYSDMVMVEPELVLALLDERTSRPMADGRTATTPASGDELPGSGLAEQPVTGTEKRAADTSRPTTALASRPFLEAINGNLHLWRIGELTATQTLEVIEEWISSVEAGERGN